MKRIILLYFAALIVLTASSQNITGLWYGHPNVKTARLRIIVDIQPANTEGKLTIKVQSTDQSKEWFPVDSYELDGKQLSFTVERLNLSAQCTIESDALLDGKMRMDGGNFPLTLTRTPIVFNRPQTPKAPFPYASDDITFRNDEDKITLAGTLTLPKSKKPVKVVILLSGTGPHTRDSEFFEHKPFAIIADYLARRGIATLRYDERGVGKSEGDFSTASIPEFASDAEAAIAYLKTRPEILSDKIGVIGHSEGVAVAFTIAAQDAVAFVVTLAGGGISGEELLLMQRAALLEASGADAAFIENFNNYMRKAQQIALQTANKETCQAQLAELFRGSQLAGSEQAIATQLHNPTILGMLKYNPEYDYPEITVPVLALNGDKDRQVPVDNLQHIEKGLKENGNNRVTIKVFPGLNHMFQTANTGLPDEYAIIEESFNPAVLKVMGDWIEKQ